MHARTAICLAGGSGSGPEKPSAYRALFSSRSSVTVMAALLGAVGWTGGRSAAGGGEPQVVPQCGAGVVAAEDAAFLEQRHHPVDERVESAGGDVRDQHESVGRVG